MSRFAWTPFRTPPDPAPPALVLAIHLRLSNGNIVEYPMHHPTRLTRPPSVINIIGGVAYIDERQS